MKLFSATALLMGFTLLLFVAQAGHAGVFICEDAVTGKKTFTDKACPSAEKGKKVRVEPTNFGNGTRARNSSGTWNSQRDTSVAGRENFSGHARRLNAAKGASAPGS